MGVVWSWDPERLPGRARAGRQAARRALAPPSQPSSTHPSIRPSVWFGTSEARLPLWAPDAMPRVLCPNFANRASLLYFSRSRTRKGRFEPGPLKGAREARRFSWLESEWERVVKRSGNRRKWMGRRGQKCALDWMCTRSCCDSLSVSGPRFETLVSV